MIANCFYGTAIISRQAARNSKKGEPGASRFVGKSDALPEIWAYGFRNPWRCAFDTGGKHERFCGDVGQNPFEEIDIVSKGGNYGWRVKEGTHCFDYVNPKVQPSRYTPRFVYDRVTNGFRGMPSWKHEFSEAERKAVTAYVMSQEFSN